MSSLKGIKGKMTQIFVPTLPIPPEWVLGRESSVPQQSPSKASTNFGPCVHCNLYSLNSAGKACVGPNCSPWSQAQNASLSYLLITRPLHFSYGPAPDSNHHSSFVDLAYVRFYFM